MRFAADIRRGIEKLAGLFRAALLLRQIVEQLEAVAGLDALLEVDVVGMDLQEFGDEVVGKALRLGRAIGAEIDGGALARVFFRNQLPLAQVCRSERIRLRWRAPA